MTKKSVKHTRTSLHAKNRNTNNSGNNASQMLTALDAGETKPRTNGTSVPSQAQTAIFQAEGMHCASCTIVIERKLKKLEGVTDVRVDSFTRKVELVGAPIPSLASLHHAVKDNGYSIVRAKGHGLKTRAFPKNTSQDYWEI